MIIKRARGKEPGRCTYRKKTGHGYKKKKKNTKKHTKIQQSKTIQFLSLGLIKYCVHCLVYEYLFIYHPLVVV